MPYITIMMMNGGREEIGLVDSWMCLGFSSLMYMPYITIMMMNGGREGIGLIDSWMCSGFSSLIIICTFSSNEDSFVVTKKV